jgi:tetratricopeptide (TPR) repeat protein
MRSLFERLGAWKIAGITALLAVVSFGPFIGNEFVTLDDDYLIYNNPAVKSFTWSGIKHVFTHYDPQLYIPVTFLSFQLNAAMFGMNAAGFHLVNVLLHALNAVLVFFILRRLSTNDLVAGLTAILFAIHPLQTEAVLWAAGRKDVLSGFFCLLSILWYLKYREAHSPERLPLVLSVVFYGIGLLAKVSIIPLPVFLLMIDWLERREFTKRMVLEKLPYFALAIILGVVAIMGKTHVVNSAVDTQNLLLPLISATFYLTKLMLPLGFSVMYLFQKGSSVFVQFGPSAIALLFIVAIFAWALWKKHRLLAFFIATYFLFLAPSFVNAYKGGFVYFASDRYAYLACIGALGVIAGFLSRAGRILEKKSKSTMLVTAVSIALVVILIPLSWKQAAVWKNSEALYTNVVTLYPNTPMAYTNLGVVQQLDGRLDEAKKNYEESIRLNPAIVHPYFDLGNLLGKQGKLDEAAEMYVKIVDYVEVQPIENGNEIEPFIWLIGKLNNIGKTNDAARLEQKLIEKFPTLPQIHAYVGFKARDAGNGDLTLQELNLADQLGSEDPKVYMALAEIYSTLGDRDETIRVLRKLLRIDPENSEAKAYLQQLQ